MDNNIACLKIEHILWDKFIADGYLKRATLSDIQHQLRLIEPELRAMHEEHSSEGDDRTGYETYGYNNLDSVKSNLEYISDRWSCQFRLRWLLDLLEVRFND